jgi:hypothetical protein
MMEKLLNLVLSIVEYLEAKESTESTQINEKELNYFLMNR